MSEKLEILLVENDDINKSVIKAYLKHNYNVEIVENGPDAIEAVKNKQFDLILMDINLGRGMSGIDVTRKIRTFPGYETTPIIAVTAFALEGDREEFLDAGCSNYLSKPFLKSQLLDIIQQSINT
ncbi:MAG TPA: response regulator [Ignavibacteriaceae bacterium]|nr:response regulator [Ignavibacteriaceae bacterium]